MDGRVDQLRVRLRTYDRVSVSGHLCRHGLGFAGLHVGSGCPHSLLMAGVGVGGVGVLFLQGDAET